MKHVVNQTKPLKGAQICVSHFVSFVVDSLFIITIPQVGKTDNLIIHKYMWVRLGENTDQKKILI